MASSLSVGRLQRLDERMAEHVARKATPGVVALVHRRGETHATVTGSLAFDRPPMRRDAIFRISSMTKPMLAVVTLSLVEEGLLRLDEPIERLLPELAARRVLERPDGPLEATVPAARAITVRDLLTFRLGFGHLFSAPDAPIMAAARERALGLGPPRPRLPPAPDEWLRRFAELPLIHQPGTRWMYNAGAEVLAVLVARASGKPLAAVFEERLFGPLGMKDTSFQVPVARRDRLTTSYLASPDGEAPLSVYDDAAASDWAEAPAFPSGAAGLVSTADDCLAFARMLLASGRHGRRRVLSRPSVLALATDQLSTEEKATAEFFPGFFASRGWGLGVAVVTARAGVDASPGAFGWDGGLGTSMWIDPAEELIGILLTQRGGPPWGSPIHADFWALTYAAIDD